MRQGVLRKSPLFLPCQAGFPRDGTGQTATNVMHHAGQRPMRKGVPFRDAKTGKSRSALAGKSGRGFGISEPGRGKRWEETAPTPSVLGEKGKAPGNGAGRIGEGESSCSDGVPPAQTETESTPAGTPAPHPLAQRAGRMVGICAGATGKQGSEERCWRNGQTGWDTKTTALASGRLQSPWKRIICGGGWPTQGRRGRGGSGSRVPESASRKPCRCPGSR